MFVYLHTKDTQDRYQYIYIVYIYTYTIYIVYIGYQYILYCIHIYCVLVSVHIGQIPILNSYYYAKHTIFPWTLQDFFVSILSSEMNAIIKVINSKIIFIRMSDK